MTHETHDRISLEIARRIAAGLSDHPEWIVLAQSNLNRWRTLNADSPSLLRCYEEWASLLNRPLPVVIEALTADTADSQRLRQNSPFAGALTPQIVWDIKHRIRHEQNAA
jgi:hypothetical protein